MKMLRRWGGVLLAAVACATWRPAQASCLGNPWTSWVAVHNDSGSPSRTNFNQPSVVLDSDNWASHQVVSGIARVLLEEGLGQTAILVDHDNWTPDWIGRLTGGNISANLEVWTTGAAKQHALSQWRCAGDTFQSTVAGPCLIEAGHSYAGTSAQSYVGQAPGSNIAQLDYWAHYADNTRCTCRHFGTDNALRAFLCMADSLSISPCSAPMLALPPPNFTVAGFPRHLCSNLTTPIGSVNLCAPDGRFYPAACGGVTGNAETAVAAGCKAYFAASSGWDYGLAEAAIIDKGLLLVITYIGIDAAPLGYTTVLGAYMQAAFAAG
jgi:hypothetical protein